MAEGNRTSPNERSDSDAPASGEAMQVNVDVTSRRPPFDWRWWAGGAAFLFGLAFTVLAVTSAITTRPLRTATTDQHEQLAAQREQIDALQRALDDSTDVANCRAKLVAERDRRQAAVDDAQTAVDDAFNSLLAAAITASQTVDPAERAAAQEATRAATAQFAPAQQARAKLPKPAETAMLRAQYERDTSKPCPI